MGGGGGEGCEGRAALVHGCNQLRDFSLEVVAAGRGCIGCGGEGHVGQLRVQRQFTLGDWTGCSLGVVAGSSSSSSAAAANADSDAAAISRSSATLHVLAREPTDLTTCNAKACIRRGIGQASHTTDEACIR